MGATGDSLPLRDDARRNYERIVTAAESVFAERGLDAPISEIAQRAGVGEATLYRRFESKADLIYELYARRLRTLEPDVARAFGREDAREGLLEVFRVTLELLARDRGFTEAALRLGPDAVPRDVHDAFFAPLAQLLARAQAQGTIRNDIDAADLPILLRMLSVTAWPSRSQPTEPQIWSRYLEFLEHGLCPTSSPPPRAPQPLPRP
jgi:AcrR family transcriptional regulator